MKIAFGLSIILAFVVGCANSKCKTEVSCVSAGGPDAAVDVPAEQPADVNENADVASEEVDDVADSAKEAADSGCSADARFDCATAGVGHFCSDLTVPATCVDGKWQCGLWSVPSSECRCFGPVGNGCSYTRDCVLQCPDASSDREPDAASEVADGG